MLFSWYFMKACNHETTKKGVTVVGNQIYALSKERVRFCFVYIYIYIFSSYHFYLSSVCPPSLHSWGEYHVPWVFRWSCQYLLHQYPSTDHNPCSVSDGEERSKWYNYIYSNFMYTGLLPYMPKIRPPSRIIPPLFWMELLQNEEKKNREIKKVANHFNLYMNLWLYSKW